MRGIKPAVLKLVSEVDQPGSVPRAPAWLSEEGKVEWRRVAPMLLERRILSRADLSFLASYCVAFGQIVQCARLIAADGLIIEGRLDTKVQHPATQIMHRAQAQMRQHAAELGLTPVSRSRAALVDKAEGDDFSDLDL